MRRSVTIMALAAFLLAAVPATPVSARPGEMPTSADAFLVEVVDPGESTIDGNMWHVRGFTLRYQVVGDENPSYQTGVHTSVVNWNWNLKNGATQSWGSWETALEEFDGGYAGSFTINVPPSEGAIAGPDFDPADPATWGCVEWRKGLAVGQGYGDLAGAQIRSDVLSDSCGAVARYEATVFFPGG